MKNKIRFFLLLPSIALIFLANPAFAVNDGHMDDVWLKVRITSTMSVVDWSKAGVGAEFLRVNLDSGSTDADTCWMQFRWKSLNSFKYNLRTICPVNGNFTVIGDQEQQEFSNGNIGSTYNWIELRDMNTRNSSSFENELAINGSVIFKPFLRGVMVNVVSVSGFYTAYYLKRTANDYVSYFEGVGKAGLAIKFIPKTAVPSGVAVLGQ